MSYSGNLAWRTTATIAVLFAVCAQNAAAQSKLELIHTIPKAEDEFYVIKSGGVGKKTVGPGYVIKKRKRVRCINRRGKSRRQASISNPDASHSGFAAKLNSTQSHFLLVTRDPKDSDASNLSSSIGRVASIYDHKCRKRWELSEPRGRQFELGPKGKAVAALGARGRITRKPPQLYSKKTQMQTKQAPTPSWTLGEVSRLAFSSAGEMFAVEASRRDGGDGIIAYNSDGDELWRAKFDTAKKLVFSPDGSVILVHGKRDGGSAFGVHAFEAADGTELWEQPGAMLGGFSPDGRNAIVRHFAPDFSGSEVRMVGMRDGVVSFKFPLPGMRALDVRIDRNVRRLLIAADIWDMAKGLSGQKSEHVILVDMVSGKQWRNDYPRKTFQKFPQANHPIGIEFSRDSSRVAVVLKRKIEIYRVEE